MNKIVHLITTIERGGAENQLLVLVREQLKNSDNLIEIIFLKGKPELKINFENLGAKVNNSVANLSIFSQIIRIWKYFRHKNLIIHAHLPRAELLAAVTKGSNKLVFSRHNTETFIPGAPGLSSTMLSKFVAKRSHAGIAISYAVLKFLGENNEIPKKFNMEVIHYGFNSDDIFANKSPNDAFAEIGIDSEHYIVGTISRLTEQKNLHTLLLAFKSFNSTVKKSKLIIIGAGPLESKLKEEAYFLGISSNVYWMGKQENVYNFLQIFDVFVLTSKYEGFGLVLLEAISMNTPIIASNNSAIPEVLGDNYLGFCATENSDDFADQILKLQSIAYRKKLLKQLSLRLSFFSAEDMSKKIDKVYFS